MLLSMSKNFHSEMNGVVKGGHSVEKRYLHNGSNLLISIEKCHPFESDVLGRRLSKAVSAIPLEKKFDL